MLRAAIDEPVMHAEADTGLEATATADTADHAEADTDADPEGRVNARPCLLTHPARVLL
jgi:hypothetical protein